MNTTPTLGDPNSYQLAFIGLAFQIIDIFLSSLVLLFQNFMTGVFSIFLPH